MLLQCVPSARGAPQIAEDTVVGLTRLYPDGVPDNLRDGDFMDFLRIGRFQPVVDDRRQALVPMAFQLAECRMPGGRPGGDNQFADGVANGEAAGELRDVAQTLVPEAGFRPRSAHGFRTVRYIAQIRLADD